MKIGTDQHRLRFCKEIIPTNLKACRNPSLTLLALAGMLLGVSLPRS